MNAYSALKIDERPSLFFEFHGTSEDATDAHAKTVGEIVRDNNGGNFQWATTPEERSARLQKVAKHTKATGRHRQLSKFLKENPEVSFRIS